MTGMRRGHAIGLVPVLFAVSQKVKTPSMVHLKETKQPRSAGLSGVVHVSFRWYTMFQPSCTCKLVKRDHFSPVIRKWVFFRPSDFRLLQNGHRWHVTVAWRDKHVGFIHYELSNVASLSGKLGDSNQDSAGDERGVVMAAVFWQA